MKWSEAELRAFKPWIKEQIRLRTSWAARARRWNKKFRTKRSANSLRGLWNRLDWGWKPKRQIRRVECRVGEIVELSDPAHASPGNACPEAPSAAMEDQRLAPAQAIPAVRSQVWRAAARNRVTRHENTQNRFAMYLLFCEWSRPAVVQQHS